MRSLLLWLFLATSANAQLWQRHILSAKGESFDSPQPHPLAYFTRDPFLRDEGDDFCSDCTPRGKASVHLQHSFKTEFRKVGALQGFAIYDLFYRFDDPMEAGMIGWKSILVEVSPGRFREIYHLQPTDAIVQPSFFLKAGSDQILATRDSIPGTGNYAYEDYFWFSDSGPTRIEIEAIAKAVQSILPAGLGVWKGGGLDMEALRYHMPVWKEGDGNCCPTGGTVDIKVRLDGSRIIVTSKYYDPSAEVD